MKVIYILLAIVTLSACTYTVKKSTIRYDAEVSDVKFDFAKFNIDAEDKKILDAYIAQQNEKYNGDYKVAVVGRTDYVNTTDFNIDLGFKRAAATARYLESKGVRIEFVQSAGETDDVVIDPYIAQNFKSIGVRETNRSITLITIHK